jgi:hypothetical protein
MIAVLNIALILGSVGMVNLDRGGHRKVKRWLNLCLTVLFLIICIPGFTPNRLVRNVSGWNIPGAYSFIPLFVLLVAIFPLSLYLNRKQKKSTSQTTSADVS